MHFYRDPKDKVWLQEYSPLKRRTVRLPRAKSLHMDTMSNEEIRAELAIVNGDVVPKLFEGLPVRKYFERWVLFLGARGFDPQTIRQHRHAVETFLFRFFAEAVKVSEAKDWPAYSIRFYNWLETVGNNGKPATASQIKQANIAFKKFYTWLGEEGYVTPLELKLRNAVSEVKPAVLPRPVSPSEVLAWAKKCDKPHVRVLGLVGYFCSLRPQEVFALVRSDFSAGDSVVGLECSRVMRGAGLFDRAVVYISKQQQNSGRTINSAKKGSNGFVSCFNLEAAQLIIETIKSMAEAESVVGGWNNHKLYTDWHKFGLADLNVKDLRRASLYFLGQYSNLQPQQLMKHARHRSIETTMIYCRRPHEQITNRCASLDLGV